MCLTPTLVVPSHWFSTRLGVASGYGVAGAGVGGLVFGPIVQLLITRLGVNSALRILAGIILVMNCFPAILCKAGISVSNRTSGKYKWETLRSREFVVLAFLVVFMGIVFFVPNFLLPCNFIVY